MAIWRRPAGELQLLLRMSAGKVAAFTVSLVAE